MNGLTKGFNEIIHAPNRLQICAFLATAAEVEFGTLKAQLEVSDSVLSKHLKVLEENDYIRLKKRTSDGRQRTWLEMTANGHRAYNGHVKALKAMLDH